MTKAGEPGPHNYDREGRYVGDIFDSRFKEERKTSTDPEFVYEKCPHCGRSHRCRPKPETPPGHPASSYEGYFSGDAVRFKNDTAVENSSGDRVVVPEGTEAVVIQIKEFPNRLRVWVEFDNGDTGWVSARVLEKIPVENLN